MLGVPHNIPLYIVTFQREVVVDVALTRPFSGIGLGSAPRRMGTSRAVQIARLNNGEKRCYVPAVFLAFSQSPFASTKRREALRYPLPFALHSGRADEAADIASAKSLPGLRAVARRVMPSVVKIKTTARPRAFSTIPNPADDNRSPDAPFQRHPAVEPPGLVLSETPARAGLGSGVIIDSHGIILTNYHVVEEADEVIVELADGRQYRADDIKGDEPSDLAVIRIKVDHPLRAATLGDSDKLEIGDWVLALGHPFDLDLTVSAGIISGKGRVLPSGGRAAFLQTDAAINPGNSGGPLVNLDGEVVGIDTAIASHSGASQGVGFAIPAQVAKWVARQLIDKGSVQRAYLGVRIEEGGDRQAAERGIELGKGLLIADVLAESPAAKAGLHPNDRILQFAGHDVHNPHQLQEIVEQAPLDAPQSIKIIRNNKTQTLNVIVGPLPKTLGLAAAILQAPRPRRAWRLSRWASRSPTRPRPT